ncbi:hypothetical protein KIPB_006019, partial [Kipferlia bialata]
QLTQLDDLSDYSSAELKNLLDSALPMVERLNSAIQEIERQTQEVETLVEEARTDPETVLGSHCHVYHRPSLPTLPQHIFSPDNRPQGLKALYERAAPPPSLSRLDQYRADGKECLSIYTDRGYMLRAWAEEQVSTITRKAKKAKKSPPLTISIATEAEREAEHKKEMKARKEAEKEREKRRQREVVHAGGYETAKAEPTPMPRFNLPFMSKKEKPDKPDKKEKKEKKTGVVVAPPPPPMPMGGASGNAPPPPPPPMPAVKASVSMPVPPAPPMPVPPKGSVSMPAPPMPAGSAGGGGGPPPPPPLPAAKFSPSSPSGGQSSPPPAPSGGGGGGMKAMLAT